MTCADKSVIQIPLKAVPCRNNDSQSYENCEEWCVDKNTVYKNIIQREKSGYRVFVSGKKTDRYMKDMYKEVPYAGSKTFFAIWGER